MARPIYGHFMIDNQSNRYSVSRYGTRNFAVYDGKQLIAVTVYKKGAVEVARQLCQRDTALGTVGTELNKLSAEAHTERARHDSKTQ